MVGRGRILPLKIGNSFVLPVATTTQWHYAPCSGVSYVIEIASRGGEVGVSHPLRQRPCKINGIVGFLVLFPRWFPPRCLDIKNSASSPRLWETPIGRWLEG